MFTYTFMKFHIWSGILNRETPALTRLFITETERPVILLVIPRLIAHFFCFQLFGVTLEDGNFPF